MTRPLVVGLTGSIGMGKSTTADMFAAQGIPIWDADSAVHRLYGNGGAGVDAIARICPVAVKNGRVHRNILREQIDTTPRLLDEIERLIHPLVAADREAFLAESNAEIVLVDIPLLFETSGESDVDKIVVVTTSQEAQKSRVLARPGVTQTHFETILSKQMPDAEKRSRADFIVNTDTLESAESDVQDIVEQLRNRRPNA